MRYAHSRDSNAFTQIRGRLSYGAPAYPSIDAAQLLSGPPACRSQHVRRTAEILDGCIAAHTPLEVCVIAVSLAVIWTAGGLLRHPSGDRRAASQRERAARRIAERRLCTR